MGKAAGEKIWAVKLVIMGEEGAMGDTAWQRRAKRERKLAWGGLIQVRAVSGSFPGKGKRSSGSLASPAFNLARGCVGGLRTLSLEVSAFRNQAVSQTSKRPFIWFICFAYAVSLAFRKDFRNSLNIWICVIWYFF